MEVVGACGERQVEAQEVVRQVWCPLVSGGRKRRDASVREERSDGVGERRFGLGHQSTSGFGSTASIPGTASDYGG
jgi:hypothetical protein